MPRRKYEIDSSDVLFAKEYLISQLASEAYSVNEPGKFEFLKFVRSIDPVNQDLDNDARLLNRWCETCLSSDQWERLKISIRKKRRAQKTEDVTLTINSDAHQALLRIKEISGTDTLSQAILWAESQLM